MIKRFITLQWYMHLVENIVALYLLKNIVALHFLKNIVAPYLRKNNIRRRHHNTLYHGRDVDRLVVVPQLIVFLLQCFHHLFQT